MAKGNNRNNKPQTINNIKELNLEIDYDKLAQAIVKAQNEADKSELKDSKFTVGTITTLLMLVLKGTALFGWFAAFISVLAVVHKCTLLEWSSLTLVIGNIVALVSYFGIVGMLILFPLLLWKSSKEVELEKDKNYLVALFSCIVSIVALIVALVS